MAYFAGPDRLYCLSQGFDDGLIILHPISVGVHDHDTERQLFQVVLKLKTASSVMKTSKSP